MKNIEIKSWFENKLAEELGLQRLYHLEMFCATKETEKAFYGIFYTGYNANGTKANHRAHWIPKSAIENPEDVDLIADYDEALKSFESEYAM